MRRMKLPIRRPWIPYIILVIALLITSLGTLYVIRATDEIDRLRFESAVQESQNSINSRIETYIALLRGGAGLLAANPNVSKEEFRLFVDRLQLQESYPGIQGIGYVEKVPADQKEAFIQNQLENGININFRPERQVSEYFPILYLEPDDYLNNNSAPGYDISSEPIRNNAIRRAIDTGLRSASAKVILNQSDKDKKQAGFLIYIPVFDDAIVPKTIALRREKISGFVYAPFRADDLLTDILSTQSKSIINFQVYDGTTINKANLLHDSRIASNTSANNYTPRYQTTRTLNVGGETWTLTFANQSQFEKYSQRGLAPIILLSGLMISFTVFLLSRSQYIARSVAEESAIQLRQSQRELQKAIGIRDNFISIASHELKTPVTSLKVYSEVLYRNFVNTGDSKSSDYMQKMNKQIDKLTTLIQDLLDVSRIQSGKLAFREEEFSLMEMITDIIENTNPIASKHKIILKGKTKRTVWGDKERLGQVLSNFLTNAIKYSPKANKIIIHVHENNDMAAVSVQDFGIGIASEHMGKIFNRFYRVTDENQHTYPGLGMGLYICSEIIKRHGGTITVESTKGKGSLFTFTVPLFKAKDTPRKS